MMATTSSIFTCGISYYNRGMAATNRTLIVHDNITKFLAFKKSITPNKISVYVYIYIYIYIYTHTYIQGGSLARGPKLLSMYTVEQRGFLVLKYWQTGSFKACQTALRTEFGERRAPSKCSIQKLIKRLETRGSRPKACRLLSLGPI